MGLFDKGLEFNKLATNVSKVRMLLDQIENKVYSSESALENKDDYCFVAYICRIGIIERMEKYNWKLSTKIIIGINGKPTSVSLHESYIMSVLKLTMMSQINSDVSETVNDILEKGEQFFVMDSQFTKEAIKKI